MIRLNMSTSKTRKFKIEYSKQISNGAAKWEAGYLIQSWQDGKAWIWLKNSDKVTIRKGSVNESFVSKLDSREALTCAGYKIRILIENEPHVTSAPPLPPQCSKPLDVPREQPFPSASKVETTDFSSFKPHDRQSTNDTTPRQCFLDPVLLRSMRSYQIEAASFLLNRLQDGTCRLHPGVSASSLNSGIPLTGAILADDMGTGKTLVGISVIWALCRHGQGKGVIVCPSSLIQNWRKEINKWLPKTARTTIYITGQGGGKANDLNVHAFVSSHASVHPLLVISYDMFRIYAEAFNTILTLHTIICDEGHRLKNSVGTKTSLALGNCIAMQRLVLTGTPIQNNLDELFAVVNFTVPGYLGSLEEFQRKFARVIEAGNDPEALPKILEKAEAARDELSNKLRTILIRRTGETLLRDVLPPRHEFIVALSMQGSQEERYLEVAHSLLRGDTSTAVPAASSNKRKHLSECIENTDIGLPCKPLPPTLVLPGLQRLRVICSSGIVENADELDIDETLGNVSRATKRSKNGVEDVISSYSGSIADVMSNSSKLHVLYSILHYMKSHKSLRHDKVVIASNFISTLNTIEPIVKASGHQFLRIDGSVASEKRQNIVDLFNNENSAFTVCLISVKAGGVGLNLIGANRLILFEPDYNPATDQQAIGRVWRVGQKKEVFIYRMVCASSIEESILGRQRHKNLLSTVITETTNSTRKSSKAPDSMHCDSSTSQVSIDVSNYDFSSQAPGVLKELILPSRARDIGKVEKEKVKIEYDDVILNELLSDELVTCRIKVKAT